MSHQDDIRALIGQLEAAPLDDDAAFTSLVQRAFHVAGLDRWAFAERSKCARSTVERWICGKAFPGPLVRKSIFARLTDDLRHYLERNIHDKTKETLALRRLYGWLKNLSTCPDCTPRHLGGDRWQHEYDCAVLEDLNSAAFALGRERLDGYFPRSLGGS